MNRLYPFLLGTSFSKLHPQIQRLHSQSNHILAIGECKVKRGSGLIASLVAYFMNLPQAGCNVPVRVQIKNEQHCEVWERDFDGKKFITREKVYERSPELICEEIYLLPFENYYCKNVFVLNMTAKLLVTESGITWEVQDYYFTNLFFKLPKFISPTLTATESTKDSYFSFDITAHLPMKLGLLVNYQGVLKEIVLKE